MKLLALVIPKIQAIEKLESMGGMNAERIYQIVLLATDDKELANKTQNQWILKEAELEKY